MIEEIPRSPSSVRSWRSLSPRARSKVYIEEDMDGPKPHSNIHNSIYQSEHPQDIEDDHTQLSEPSGTPVETHIRGTNGRLLQPPKTPPKIAECVLPSDEHMNLTDRIPFDKEYAVDLSIEEAVGLPLTASYTRIQAKLHMPTRNDVRDTSNFCYADVLSEYTSPKFTFTTRFRGKMLHQTMTIIIRLDTLEVPAMEPKTIGYAAIRLCVNQIGMQPLSEILSDGKPSCYYNTGEFMVPLLYGTFPQVPFVTETKFHECLPHIDGAYLRIKLAATKGDAPSFSLPTNSQHGSSGNNNNTNNNTNNNNSTNGTGNNTNGTANGSPQRMSTFFRSGSFQRSGSSRRIILSALTSQPSFSGSVRMIDVASTKTIPEQVHPSSKTILSVTMKGLINKPELQKLLKIDDHTIHLFRSGEAIDPLKRHEIVREVSALSVKLFEELPDPKIATNSQYLLPYREEIGCMAKLDVLYNMPDRKKLIQSAERAASVAAMRTGLARKWDNKINFFKTVFRYLPGSYPSDETALLASNSQDDEKMSGSGKTAIQELIIDDASVKPSLQSTETCPVYLDEFSCTAEMKLGPHACLLLIVTAVDVLTTKKTTAETLLTPPPLESTHSTAHMLSPNNSKMSLLSGSDDPAGEGGAGNGKVKADKASKAQRLKGLLGVYVGRDDPRATWWGLVPLFAKNPMSPDVPPSSSSTSMFSSSSGSIHGSYRFTTSSPNHHKSHPNHNNDNNNNSHHSSTHLASTVFNNSDGNGTGTGNGTNELQSTLSSLSSLSSFPLFVNEGTHQIPLFQGLPPDEMIKSPDPIAWLIRRLHQQAGKVINTRSSFSAFTDMLLSPLVMAGLMTQRPVEGEEETASTSIRSNSNRSKRGKKKKKKNNDDLIILSAGCSAFVRVVDPRMKRIAGNSIAEESSKSYSSYYVQEVITLSAQQTSETTTASSSGGTRSHLTLDANRFKQLKNDFAYQPTKVTNRRQLKAAIPDTIEPFYLFQEVTEKFYQALATSGR